MILYSSVTLKTHANMVAFLDVLEQSARRDPQSGGLARCVKRSTFGLSRTMARILPLCKNLVILVNYGPASGPGQFAFPEFPPHPMSKPTVHFWKEPYSPTIFV